MDLSYIPGMNLKMISANEAKSEKFGLDLPSEFKAKIISALEGGCYVAEIYASKVKIAYFICEYVKEYFGEPNSHKAHELLHTSYVKREKY